MYDQIEDPPEIMGQRIHEGQRATSFRDALQGTRE